MPTPFRDNSLGAPDNRIHMAPPGDERANFRSATPRGFARAVYEANRPDRITLAGWQGSILHQRVMQFEAQGSA